jgi:hypothetical protein
MMNEMMKQCCGEEGMPNLEKMKEFMEKYGKTEFSQAEVDKMKQFRDQQGKPDFEKMKQFMESCGCRFPGSESTKSD